jgi:hypothetical protein
MFFVKVLSNIYLTCLAMSCRTLTVYAYVFYPNLTLNVCKCLSLLRSWMFFNVLSHSSLYKSQRLSNYDNASLSISANVLYNFDIVCLSVYCLIWPWIFFNILLFDRVSYWMYCSTVACMFVNGLSSYLTLYVFSMFCLTLTLYLCQCPELLLSCTFVNIFVLLFDLVSLSMSGISFWPYMFDNVLSCSGLYCLSM